MSLTDTKCRNAKPRAKPFKISDGGGLYLQVQPTGGKLWRLAYRYHGKQKTLALGPYPVVPLKDARSKREWAKELLVKDIDPCEAKKAKMRASRLAVVNTFEVIADEWFKSRRPRWTEVVLQNRTVC